MKKFMKKAISSVLAVSMLISSFGMNLTEVAAASKFSAAGGWFETLFAELNVDPSVVASVTYTKNGGSAKSLSDYDLEYLVRENGTGKTRIDIPGVPAGTYSLSVKLENGTEYAQSDITVYKNDRSGYAHKDAKDEGVNGIGAYDNDGNLKSNAVVIYVTEDNKNTVTVPGLSNSPVGIGNILNYKSDDSNGTTGGKKADALQKLANDNIPLDIRFVGTVIGGDSNTRNDPPSKNVLGLTQYNGTGNGGTVKDNGMIARMFNAKNITIEGIGTDAVIDGWGFQVIAGTARPSQSIEFRNLTFKTTPEDAIGLEGTVTKSKDVQSKEYLNKYAPIKFCWVHNCTFETGYCKNPAESDKAQGDGSLDFKRGYGFTQDYNRYIENHKTNLIGSSSDSIQYDVTYHHNYYDQVWSRQPLVRQANVHIYNSYFKNGSNTSYIISPRAHSYTLSEKNYYENCKNPVENYSEGAAYVKSYQDNFSACTGDNYANIVSSRSTAVSGVDNPYKSDFDSSSFPYDYTATDAVQAKADCIAKAGVMKPAGEIDMNPSKISVLDEYPSAPISLTYTLDLSQTYAAGRTVVNNAILNAASKSTGGSVKIRNNGIIFAVTQNATVTFRSGSSSKYGMALMDQYGVVRGSVATSGSASVNIEPGVYVLKSGNIEKDAYLEAFKVVASGSSTTVEYTTQPTTEGTTSKAAEATTKKTETPVETTTQNENSEITGEGYIWNYTTGENTDDFFFVDGNDWTGQAVTYQGASLTKAVKMESSTDIHFDVAGAGTLKIFTYSTKDQPTIEINDGVENVSQNGINTFDINYSQTVYITKGTTSTYVYFMQFIPRAEEVPGETTTQATTQAATQTPVTEAPTQATTQQQSASGSVKISVEKVNAGVGSTASVPVKAANSNNKNIGGYVIALSYDSSLKYNGVTNKASGQFVDYSSGGTAVFAYVGSASPNSTLFEVNLTPSKSGTFPVTVISQEIIDTSAARLGADTSSNGSITAAYASKGSGDVYKDGIINDLDAVYLLKYISGENITGIANIDLNEANCDGSTNTEPDMLDVVWILQHKTAQTETESSTETTTLDLSGSSFIANWDIANDPSIPDWLDCSGASITANGSSYKAFKTTLNMSSNFPKAVSIPEGSFSFAVDGKKTVKLYLASDHNDDNKSKATFTFVGTDGKTSVLASDVGLPGRKNDAASPITLNVTGEGVVKVDLTYKARFYKAEIS